MTRTREEDSGYGGAGAAYVLETVFTADTDDRWCRECNAAVPVEQTAEAHQYRHRLDRDAAWRATQDPPPTRQDEARWREADYRWQLEHGRER